MIVRAGSAMLGAALLLSLAGCGTGKAPDNGLEDIVTTGNAVVQEAAPDGSALASATPMRERVAVIGLLNKRNGRSWQLKLKPGEWVRVGDVIVRLRACEKTAPWEQDEWTGAFVQMIVHQVDNSWQRVFSGWLYKEQPSQNVVIHPIYDVWTVSCSMTFKDSGPDTVSVGAGPRGASGGASDSSAKKSPSTEGEPSDSPAEVSPSAAPSNAI